VCGRWQFLLFVILWFDWRNLLLECVSLIKFFPGELQKVFTVVTGWIGIWNLVGLFNFILFSHNYPVVYCIQFVHDVAIDIYININ
jgi:hypothetical protein